MRKIILADNQDISNAGWHFVLQNNSDVLELIDVSTKNDLISFLVENSSPIKASDQKVDSLAYISH